MFSIGSTVRAASLAALLVATSVAAVAQNQAPADSSNSGSGKVPPPLMGMPPGYNPGEMLRDLANPVVAEIDGRPITLADVGDAIRALPTNMRSIPFEELYPSVLERLIQQQALVAKARRMRIDAEPVVKRHMQAAADRVLENELLNRLADQGISESALLARYQREYGNQPGPEEVDLRIILVPTEEEARTVIAGLAGGANFADLARRVSRDDSARQGGSLGFIRREKLIPEIGAAAFVLQPGQYSPNPMQGRAGWFVLKVDARRRVPVQTFAETRESLRREMMQEATTQLAREAVAAASVRRFNMNGTNLVDEDDRQTRPGSTR